MPEPETIDESAHYDEKHLIKMWRAWKTANEMLADRVRLPYAHHAKAVIE